MEKSISSPNYKILISLLKQLRVDAEYKQEELAKKIKRPQSFVSKYESGERRLDILEIRDICLALDISLIEFARLLEKHLK